MGLGSILTGLGSLIGVYNDNKNFDASMAMSDRQFDENVYWQNYWNTHGAGTTLKSLVSAASESGIHPLAALGVGGASFSPVSSSPPNPPNTGSAIGEGLSQLLEGFDKDKKKEKELQHKKDQAEIDYLNSMSRTNIAKAERVGRDISSNAASSGPVSDRPIQNIEKIEENPIDPLSYWHKSGPYKGRFVIPMSNGTWVSPKNFPPAEVREALAGSTSSEITTLLDQLGFKEIQRPKMRSGPPQRKGKKLGETVVTGDGEYQWTKNGWKGPRKVRTQAP